MKKSIDVILALFLLTISSLSFDYSLELFLNMLPKEKVVLFCYGLPFVLFGMAIIINSVRERNNEFRHFSYHNTINMMYLLLYCGIRINEGPFFLYILPISSTVNAITLLSFIIVKSYNQKKA